MIKVINIAFTKMKRNGANLEFSIGFCFSFLNDDFV